MCWHGWFSLAQSHLFKMLEYASFCASLVLIWQFYLAVGTIKFITKSQFWLHKILYIKKWKTFVVGKLNCNLLENIHSWMVVLHSQSALILYIEKWKSFVVGKLNCNLLENIHSWMVVLHSQSPLYRLFQKTCTMKTWSHIICIDILKKFSL